MCGIWECLVKSVKPSLKVVSRDKLFTEECLSTFLCKVESILNQRTLTSISDDVNDLKAFAPRHVIIGSYKNTVPGVFHKQEIDYRQKLRWVQAAADVFWNTWKKRIFTIFKSSQKITRKIPNCRVGDLVIISTSNVPQSNWPMGRIIEVYLDRDSIVCSVKMKKSSDELSQLSGQLCLLEETD